MSSSVIKPEEDQMGKESAAKDPLLDSLIYRLFSFDELSIYNYTLVFLVLLAVYGPGLVANPGEWGLWEYFSFVAFVVPVIIGTAYWLFLAFKYAFSTKSPGRDGGPAEYMTHFSFLFLLCFWFQTGSAFMDYLKGQDTLSWLLVFPIFSFAKSAFAGGILWVRDMGKRGPLTFSKMFSEGNASRISVVACTAVLIVSFYYLQNMGNGFMPPKTTDPATITWQNYPLMNASVSLGLAQIVEKLFKREKPKNTIE
ncbi:MAG: hypothetical protein NT067_06265 [Candidatus Diapherotrites archaeon]|nr:hypothetical protein [Candidatus Diapherotrites archaeon]